MLKRAASILYAFSLLSSWPAHAAVPVPASVPAITVRGFFAALEQHQFGRALAFTEGAAAGIIARLLGEITREAARKNADVELKIRRLELTEHPPDAAGPTPVQVSYQIDVIGKKWFMRWTARRLMGTARFYVDERAPRIVAIVGQLEP